MFPLLKIPCILLVSSAFHVAFTQPNVTVLRPEERPTKLSNQERFMNFIIRNLAFRKAVFWTAGVLEIVALLTTHYPIAIFGGFGEFIALRYLGGDGHFYLTPVSVSGMILIVLGALIRWQCYSTLKSLFTFEISIRKDHQLITTGPYSVVRHPSYFGTLIVHIGMYCWYGSPGSWVRESGILNSIIGSVSVFAFATMLMAVLVSLLRRGPVEDAALKEKFGEKWDAWRRRVPFAIFPGVY